MTVASTATFDLNLNEMVEEAFERAGSELRSGYDLRTARRSLNLLFTDWSNRGVNMWTMDSGSILMVQGTATYNLPAATVDLLEHVIRTNDAVVATQADLTISRISLPTYASIPNKLTQGRPIQILVNRKQDIPSVTVWPVPDGAQTYTLVYWRLRRMYDAGTGIQTFDVPFRFLHCLVAGLAYFLAMKIPGADVRLAALKDQYDEAWGLAAGEDHEKASVMLVPRQAFI